MNRFLEKARRLALDHEYPEPLSYRLAAVLVSGGKILSTGYNDTALTSFSRHAARRRVFCLTTHAEVGAIYRARKKIDLTGTKMYVSRIGGGGRYAMARPCEMCEHVLYRYGISRAYYSIDDQHYGVLHVESQGRVTDRIYRAGETNDEGCGVA